MAVLRVKLKGRLVSEIPLSEEKAYIAGRKEDCDIVLQPEKGISREHFRLFYENSQWVVESLSRFGSVVISGERIDKAPLEVASRFNVDPYEFELLDSAARSSFAGMQDASPRSGIDRDHIANQEEKQVPSALDNPIVHPTVEPDSPSQIARMTEKTTVGIAKSVAYIKFVDINGVEIDSAKLEGRETWLAGRETSCDIILNDSRISRKQFEIRKVAGDYYLIDLESSNGTSLNGKKVPPREMQLLRSGDAIQVLDLLIYFEMRDPYFHSRMESVQVPAVLSPQNIESSSSMGNDPFTPQGVTPYQAHNNGLPSPYGSNPYPTQPYGVPPSQIPASEAKKKPNFLVIGLAVAVLGIGYYFSSNDTQNQEVTVKNTGVGADAFAKLPAEKQMLVKQSYQLAKNYYFQGKFELAKTEILKVHELVSSYEDSKEIEHLSDVALKVLEQKRKQDEIEKARAEAEVKILKVAEECKKKIGPNTTMEQLDECLAPVIALDPEHAAFAELRGVIEKLDNERKLRHEKAQAYNREVAKLRLIYEAAEKKAKQVHPIKAIEAYEKVIEANLPDPNGYKAKAERNIASIRKSMGSQTTTYIADAEKFHQQQKLKEAILALRKARQIDPKNLELQDKIEAWTNDLRKQMMTLYQEGVLEESFGNVDGGENRQGAKDRWKKILDLDIPDGEYYQKALIKIKKYGAQ